MKNKLQIEAKRTEIDNIDKEIISLLRQRFDISREIGNLKKEESLDNYDPKREEIIFENIAQILNNAKDVDKIDHVLAIYKEILTQSKNYQK